MGSAEDCFGVGNKAVRPRQQMACHFGISKDNSYILIVHQIRLSLLTSYLFNTPIEAY
jgi:hypothetical protein